jgi:hypothetical protein
VFVNNYQRLTQMPAHQETRLALKRSSTGDVLNIPSLKSPSFTVAPGQWFSW